MIDENPPLSAQKHYFPWAGPVRMLVIFLMAFGYASTMPRGPGESEYLRFFGYDPSWVMIAVLFMISGFLLARSFENSRDPVAALFRRARRIVPMLAIFALLVIAIIYPVFGVGESPGLKGHLLYFLNVVTCYDPDSLTPGLLDNALYACYIQGGLWPLRWGALILVSSAILWVFGILKRPLFVIALAVLCLAAHLGLVHYAVQQGDEPLPALLRYADLFFRLGAPFWFGFAAFGLRAVMLRNFAIPLALLAICVVHYYWLPWTPLIEPLYVLAVGFVALNALTSKRRVPAILANVPDVSLGLYVFNWPVAQLLVLSLPGITAPALICLSLPLTFIMALASHHIVRRLTRAAGAALTHKAPA